MATMWRLDACDDDLNEGVEMSTNCKDCKYYTACNDFTNGCKGCPMHYRSPLSGHTCHCCANITHDELKQKRCKFYKPNEQEGCVCCL